MKKNNKGGYLYRLEFNEKQQYFHLDNYTHEPNTHGWFTIADHCTDLEFMIFESFVNRTNKKNLTKEYLLKSLIEIKGFISNLMEYNIQIVQNNKHDHTTPRTSDVKIEYSKN